jgi:hypothetical protein
MKLTLHKGIWDGNGFSEPGKCSYIISSEAWEMMHSHYKRKYYNEGSQKVHHLLALLATEDSYLHVSLLRVALDTANSFFKNSRTRKTLKGFSCCRDRNESFIKSYLLITHNVMSQWKIKIQDEQM